MNTVDAAVPHTLLTAVGMLRQRILAEDPQACFVEREELLAGMDDEAAKVAGHFRYAWLLEQVLDRLSTPVVAEDVLIGRMVEGRTGRSAAYYGTGPWQGFVNSVLRTSGHHTSDHRALLTLGLDGIAAEAEQTARRLGTEEATIFAANCRTCARAIGAFARRYAAAARVAAAAQNEFRRENLLRAAAALEQAPAGPARNYFEAVQSVAFMHVVLSCVVGGRDIAFGRVDRYFLPFLRAGVADGSLDRTQAVGLLAHLMIKANEVAGTTSWEHPAKLVPCVGSKQYLFIGGRDAEGRDETNELSEMVLEAARIVRLREPVINIRLHRGSTPQFRRLAAEAVIGLDVELQLWNDEVIAPGLIRQGFSPEDAWDYTARGCSTTEVGMRQANHDILGNLVPWAMEALNAGPARDLDELVERYGRIAQHELHAEILKRRTDPEPTYDRPFVNDGGLHFHLESMLLRDCVARGRTHCAGGIRYLVRTAKLAGIATVADCFAAVQRLVFAERRLTLAEFMRICADNFSGHEALRQEILRRIPKFGNDCEEVDAIARRVALRTADAADAAIADGRLPGEIVIAGLYSQHLHLVFGRYLGATPDGRLAGEPISENQSPSYGTDRNGITALMASVARLPFERVPAGGLNVRFGGRIAPDQLDALTRVFFERGGMMLGYTLVGRQTLEDARAHPERYRTLTVRQFGFSEYFTVLSPEVQEEIIARTEY